MDTPLVLSSAYATWVLNEDDNKWIVRDQADNKIGEFPNHWKEKDCMIAIHLGREYELEAFNRGIEFGKDTTKKAYDPLVESMKHDLIALEQMNIKLSEKLEKFIVGEPEEVS